MKKVKPIRVLLNGARGKMGQAITRLIEQNPQKNLIVSATREAGQNTIQEPFDIVVDFTTPNRAQYYQKFCREAGEALKEYRLDVTLDADISD